MTPRDYLTLFKRAGKKLLDDNMMMLASALAYSTFFAIPSVLLVVVGLFTLVAGPETITSLIQSFGHVMPGQATQLLGDSLHRLDHHPSTTIVMTAVGLVLAIWSTTGAMNGYMTALNIAYDRKDGRSFARKRLVALEMSVCIGVAFLLVAVLLIFGPQIEKRVGPALGAPTLVAYLWWVLQWPILAAGLVTAFAILALPRPRRRAPPLAADHARRRGRRRRLARRLRALRGLHLDVRLLRQDLGLALGRDRDADVALALEPRPPLRSRAQLGDRGEPRPPPARPSAV